MQLFYTRSTRYFLEKENAAVVWSITIRAEKHRADRMLFVQVIQGSEKLPENISERRN